jgi:hypothetical protein
MVRCGRTNHRRLLSLRPVYSKTLPQLQFAILSDSFEIAHLYAERGNYLSHKRLRIKAYAEKSL